MNAQSSSRRRPGSRLPSLWPSQAVAIAFATRLVHAAERWIPACAGITGALIGITLMGCDNMANQPKRLPYELPYGAEANWPALPPAGIVARDEPLNPPGPPPVTMALLEHGQQRFEIYCAPCHSRTGDGQGMIVQRGFPAPPSYYIDRLEKAPIQHFYDVITNGYGAMYSYADRVAPADRWAIVAYIRTLQASASASVADVPADKRQALQ